MSPYPEPELHGIYRYHSGSKRAVHLYLDNGDLVQVVKVGDGYCKVRALTGRSVGSIAQVRPGQLFGIEEADLAQIEPR